MSEKVHIVRFSRILSVVREKQGGGVYRLIIKKGKGYKNKQNRVMSFTDGLEG